MNKLLPDRAAPRATRVAAAAAAAALALSMLVPARAQLPALGESGDMTIAAERAMGEKVARELYRDPDFIDDPVLDEYVLSIWTRLLAAARQRGELGPELGERFGWTVLLGKERTINAFAVPGGWMGLNLGLISATVTRDELASVLAHELSHVTQRHISRLSQQQSRTMPLVVAAMLLGILAARKSPDAAQAAIMGGQAAGAQSQLNFSRDMEREADRIGYGVATQAGFDPQGFVGMFEKLQQASRLNDNGAFPYLRTHPMTTERIAEMQSRQQMGTRATPEPDMVHAMMAGRSRVLSNPGVDALRSYVAEDATRAGTPARRAGALYAAALGSAKLRDNAGALRLAARLAEVAAGNAEAERQARLLSAEIALQAGSPARAAALETPPGKRPELLLSSEARIKTGKGGEAAQALQTWVAVNPRDAQAWQMLSQAYAAQSQTLRAIRAEAEAQVARLDYAAALDRFKAAQEFARSSAAGQRDDIEASIIDARARNVQSLLREQVLER